MEDLNQSKIGTKNIIVKLYNKVKAKKNKKIKIENTVLL